MNAYRILNNARLLWRVKGVRSAARYVARNIFRASPALKTNF